MRNEWPRISLRETIMQEGLQIERVGIPTKDKVRLLNSLSTTGLTNIVVGAFVSPKWVPQMADTEDVVRAFTPRAGVTYTALYLNKRGLEKARQLSPPLSRDNDQIVRLYGHLCDVFLRRNENRGQESEFAGWSETVEEAVRAGIKESGIGIGAAWGSNFLGEFNLQQRMNVLMQQAQLLCDAQIRIVECTLTDSMSFATPWAVEETLVTIKEKWPSITRVNLHLHDARNMAMASIYAALRILDNTCSVQLDCAVGGLGGCPFGGNGQATGLPPTEDLVHMLEGLGIQTGVDLDRVIECAWIAEEIIGRPPFGRVSKAGPRPLKSDHWYDPNLPFIETLEEAKHFRNGPSAYSKCRTPYRVPVRSSVLDQLKGMP